ncbi:hypothetical protein L210DRAFT_3512225 [Boletus edulis BED1]|uniref:Uncharacterized protein n=1 Tax=Boletus edulis BED1 TaxID=1328754 RepID=A0AAD4BAF6_BOLED|nr:hypothetical protein L210DRAFT_3512225 [Boletus edulis BED1]
MSCEGGLAGARQLGSRAPNRRGKLRGAGMEDGGRVWWAGVLKRRGTSGAGMSRSDEMVPCAYYVACPKKNAVVSSAAGSLNVEQEPTCDIPVGVVCHWQCRSSCASYWNRSSRRECANLCTCRAVELETSIDR